MKNRILTLLLSLAISFGLWLYVVTVIGPESETVLYNVPVELVGTEYLDAHDLIIVSNTKDQSMNLTLKGKRSDLSKINRSNVTIIADLSKITQPGEHQLECTVSFQAGSAEVQAQDPQYIGVTVAQQATKTIDVKPIYTGSVPVSYEADTDSVALDHKTVTVKGPKDVIDQIYYAGITIDLTNKTTMIDTTCMLTLYGPDGRPLINDQYVTANVTEVRAIVQIHKIKKVAVKFQLDFTDSGLSPDMVTVYPQLDEVTLMGTESALEKADDQFLFIIKLSDYKQTTTQTFLPPLPDGVQCKEEIVAYIQMPEMASRQFTVSRFDPGTLPDGLAVAVTEDVTVEIWGPEEVLRHLSAKDVIGMLDCTGMSEGSGRAPVKFAVPDYEYLLVRTDVQTVAVYIVQESAGD